MCPIINGAAKVGVYCNHKPDPSNSEFSVAMLHDIGQEVWPDESTVNVNLWKGEPWHKFDIGVLPGRAWSQAWQRLEGAAYASPRVGVFEGGWPKADRLFTKNAEFREAAEALKRRIGLKPRPTVLLAPSWETDDKQRLSDFVQALEDLPINLLVKYWPEIVIDKSYQLNTLTGRFGNLVILDPTLIILDGLALADLVISDESNCMAEALLLDIPAIAVKDWIVPAVPDWGMAQRFAEPPCWVSHSTRANLRSAVESHLHNLDAHRKRARQTRDELFSNLGRGSAVFMDILDAALLGNHWPVQPLVPIKANPPARK